VHAARDRAGKSTDAERECPGRQRLDLGEIIGAHLYPAAAAAQGRKRLIQDLRGRRGRGEAGDQAVAGFRQLRYGIRPVSAGGQRRIGGAPLQVENAQIETAAGQIGREVFAEISQSDEAVAQNYFLIDAIDRDRFKREAALMRSTRSPQRPIDHFQM
jgi:hypothetical protein